MRLWSPLFAFTLFALAFLPVESWGDYPGPEKLPSLKELPDPLKMFDGSPVHTKEDWLAKRKPELKKLFQHYMYGTMPDPVKVHANVERIDPKALGGKATLKEITLTLGSGDLPKIHLLVVVPNQRTKPAPVFLGMSFAGNQTVLNDAKIALNSNWAYPNRKGVKNEKATEESRGSQVDIWNIEQTIDRGYAVALVYSGDFQPDRPGVVEGVLAKLQRKAPHDIGTISAWAWGLQRVIDYLVTDADLDASKIIVVGHSRLGKTTLLAGAFDERIAAVIPHQAGCGGTAPSRGIVGESVKRINTSFPHWFNSAFKQFNDAPDKIPFDQHCLVALCAPRPVLFSNALDDQWANPDGQFDMLVAADPVYRMFGVEGVGQKKRPEVGQFMNSRLAYYIREGKHSMTRQDWTIFLEFADRQVLGRRPSK